MTKVQDTKFTARNGAARAAILAGTGALVLSSLITPTMAQDRSGPRVITADSLYSDPDYYEDDFIYDRRARFSPYYNGQSLAEIRAAERAERRAQRRAQRLAADRRAAEDRRFRERQARRHNNGAEVAIIAGVLGLAAGAIIANELGKNDRRGRQVDRVYRAPPQPARRVSGGNWIGSQAWLEHCTRKYRSFNPTTGRFLSYSGQYKLCR